MAGLRLDLKIDWKDAKARFDAIGSNEFPRAIAYVVHSTAKWAAENFRNDVMPRVLGHNIGRSGLVQSLSSYTRSAIRYDRDSGTRYDDVKSVRDIHASIYVAATQGKRGSDQSAFLKYLFGSGPQTREPGDVGLDQRKILIPNALALALTQHVNIDPSWAGGRLPKGMMATVMSHRASDNGSIPDNVLAGESSNAAAMRAMARARGGRRPAARQSGRWSSIGMRTLGSRLAIDLIHQNQRAGEYDQARMTANRLTHKTTKEGKWSKRSWVGTPWRVFMRPDDSGINTPYAAPFRIRDPAGGFHPIRRSDGSIGKMPNMLNVQPEFGKSGPRVGPKKLFTALHSANYAPKLQAPWDANIKLATEYLARQIDAEMAHRMERKAQGRKY
jgi:hypothetical protein